jgi:hypothetical protein
MNLCPRGDLNPWTREISRNLGNFHGPSITVGARTRQAFRVPRRFPPGGGPKPGRDRSGARFPGCGMAPLVTLYVARRGRTGEISAVLAEVAAARVWADWSGRSVVRERLRPSAVPWQTRERSSGSACPGLSEGKDLGSAVLPGDIRDVSA